MKAMTQKQAERQVEKVIKGNTEQLTTGQYDECKYDAIENIEELKEDLLNLVKRIYNSKK